LQERRLIDTERGRMTVGWLIVQDLAMVLALVLLPPVAAAFGGQSPRPLEESPLAGFLDPQSISGALGLTLLKVAAFILLMLVIGQRVIPWILHYVAHTGSRELFRLAVFVLALGVAFGAAELFGVSFALGAFFAGMVLAESTLSQQAAQETLPLRDAFAVLFFVSVGMLFDPSIVVREPGTVLATFLIIVIGNALGTFLIVIALRHTVLTALTAAAALSQIGEFSFILAGLSVEWQLLSGNGRDLILAGAILSILLNPLLFFILDRAKPWLSERELMARSEAAAEPHAEELPVTSLANHAVLVGCGRVGGLVADAMEAEGQAFLVIEERQEIVAGLRARGIEVISGNAAQPGLLKAANLAGARWFISAIPNPFEAVNLIEQARAANPELEIIARAHSDEEVEYLTKFGANLVIMGEREIARGMTDHIMRGLNAVDDPNRSDRDGDVSDVRASVKDG
jgi:monovalent cation:H+ antiporter-2, CPA2 family